MNEIFTDLLHWDFDIAEFSSRDWYPLVIGRLNAHFPPFLSFNEILKTKKKKFSFYFVAVRFFSDDR